MNGALKETVLSFVELLSAVFHGVFCTALIDKLAILGLQYLGSNTGCAGIFYKPMQISSELYIS